MALAHNKDKPLRHCPDFPSLAFFCDTQVTLAKAKLIDQVRRVQGVKPWEAPRPVDRLLELIMEILASGEEVLISGFGKFVVRDKHPRRGRNPQTGEELMLRERRVVVFKPSSTWRSRLNQVSADPESLWELSRRARRRR